MSNANGTRPDARAARATRALLASLAACVMVTSCGDGVAPLGERTILRLSTSLAASDTPGSFSDFAPLTVRLWGPRGPVRALVHVTVDVPRGHHAMLRSEPAAGTPWFRSGLEFDVTTDAAGTARLSLGRGFESGQWSVRAVAPALGVADSVTFETRPGSVVAIHSTPVDTALRVGASFQLRSAPTDAFGNRSSIGIRFAAYRDAAGGSTPAIDVDAQGVVRAVGTGRGYVVASFGDAAETTYVSVVPPGRIATIATSDRGDSNGILLVDLDGSAPRLLPFPERRPFRPRWLPNGTLVVEREGRPRSNEGFVLSLVDTVSGAIRDVSTNPVPGLASSEHPTPTIDGAWIYFAGTRVDDVPRDVPYDAIWRMRPDGLHAERLPYPPFSVDDWAQTQPSPSPDGSRVALVVAPGCCGGTDHVVVRDPATGTDLRIADVANASGVDEIFPRWSPSGRWIAYRDADRLTIVQPDGARRRRVGPDSLRLRQNVPTDIDWSPDERWIVARAHMSLVLIDVATGELLPLPYSYLYDQSQPAWRPSRP